MFDISFSIVYILNIIRLFYIRKRFDMTEVQIEYKLENFTDRILSKVYKKFERNQKTSTVTVIVLVLIAFVMMYFLNSFTPLAADDFNYHFIYSDNCSPETRISSFSDIVASMTNHYNETNGRVLLHGILQCFLLLGKPFFNIANAAVYVLFTLLVYKHCKGINKKSSPLLYLAINVMIWLFVQSYGTTLLWMDGSINYLWGSTIRLAALLPFRLWADGNGIGRISKILPVLLLPLSAIAGATNENSGAAFIGMCVLFIILYKIKKIKLPIWAFTSLAGSLAGFGFMVLAPGNFTRMEAFGNSTGASVLFRLANIPVHFVIYLGAPICVFAVLYLLIKKFNHKESAGKALLALIYVLGSVGGAGVMIISPYFPKRAWFGLTVCIIIACGIMLYSVAPHFDRFTKKLVFVLAVLCCIWCAGSYIQLGTDTLETFEKYEKRVEYIEEQKALGNYDIELSEIVSDNVRSPLYSISDISPNPDNWSNASKAAYYGLNSITSK